MTHSIRLRSPAPKLAPAVIAAFGLAGLLGCGAELSGAPSDTGAGDGSTAAPGGSGGRASTTNPGAGRPPVGSGSGSTTGTGSTTGSGGAPTGGPSPADPAQCNPAELPSPTPLRRLSRVEYENSLRQLLTSAALQTEVDALSAELAQLPPDGENAHLFTHMDHRVTQRHVEAYYEVANALSSRLTSDAARLAKVAGTCAGQATATPACVTAFLGSFGKRAFRRPLTAAEQTRFAELMQGATTSAEVFRRIIFSLLLSPEFLYRVETRGTVAGSDQVLTLSPHELASRLSFMFWRSAPDDALLASADSGKVATDAGFQAELDRVFEDPRTRATLRTFWDEWLGMVGFAGFANTAAFEAFLDGSTADAALYAAMTEEVHTLVDHFTWEQGGTYADLLTTPITFTRSKPLADLYGVAPYAGSGAPVMLPATERGGLLTRAALLVAGNERTNPVKRGAFVLRRLLCTEIDPPSNLPAEALALPVADPTRSTRERFAAKTAPAECAGCHALINPIGFALEAYDALGRFRSEEHVFADDGKPLSTVAVDSTAELVVDGRSIPISGPVELGPALAESRGAEICLARQYFRFTHRRDDSTADACTIAAVGEHTGPTGNLREMFRSVALHPSFRTRVIEAQ